MGLVNSYEKADRVNVTLSDFFILVRDSVKAELVMNAVNCNIPHRHIREMVTGKLEVLQSAEAAQDAAEQVL